MVSDKCNVIDVILILISPLIIYLFILLQEFFHFGVMCVCVCVKFILLNGQEFEQTLGDSEGQGSLECCSSWSHRIGHDLVMENSNSISELLELWFVSINFRIFSSVQFSHSVMSDSL